MATHLSGWWAASSSLHRARGSRTRRGRERVVGRAIGMPFLLYVHSERGVVLLDDLRLGKVVVVPLGWLPGRCVLTLEIIRVFPARLCQAKI